MVSFHFFQSSFLYELQDQKFLQSTRLTICDGFMDIRNDFFFQMDADKFIRIDKKNRYGYSLFKTLMERS